MSDIIGNNEPLVEIACRTCKHYHRNNSNVFSCNAFFEIPDIILLGENDHTSPLPDQGNDIVFEAVEN